MYDYECVLAEEKKVIKNVASRIRTCAGFPSRFLVCRLNHSAIATCSNTWPTNPLREERRRHHKEEGGGRGRKGEEREGKERKG